MPYRTIGSGMRSSLVAAVVAFLLGITFVPTGNANAVNQRMVLTFSAPVEIPGMVLPSGTYAVTKVDTYQTPVPTRILRITNQSGTHVFAMIRAIPIIGTVYHNNVHVDFYETRGNAPPAIKDIYYPGTSIGNQFIYPKGGPVLMALTGPMPPAPAAPAVPLVPEANAATPPPAPVTPPVQQQQNHQLAQATPAPATPAGQQPAAAPAANTANTAKKMPHTASDLPLLALLAMVSLAGGAGLRTLARQKN